ncbi:rod shape-determining protein MreD [Novispirillum sp. DQ9]|uniref:rod shape-determining protein MreD n=1 Tax=Novispirillum sp. DQ9 TaxID=3398612 RepID=UPI003C7CDB32
MRPSLWQRFDIFWRHQIPLVLTLALLLLSVVPSHAAGMTRIGPMFALIAVYYWAIYRPDLLGYGAVFLIGVAEDLLSSTPPGVGALALLLTHAVVLSQYRFFNARSFAVTWWAFSLVAGGAMMVKWLAVSLIHGTLVDGTAAFYAYLMTVAVYPVIGWVLARVQIAFLKDV